MVASSFYAEFAALCRKTLTNLSDLALAYSHQQHILNLNFSSILLKKPPIICLASLALLFKRSSCVKKLQQ